MGFSGGGGGVLSNHTHDAGITSDGGALAANVTQFGLTNGSILYSDGSNIQELGIGSSSEVLAVSGGAPAWITNTANPLIKVTKTFADIVLSGAYMAIYTLPQDAALVNVWADITTVFDISTAVSIGTAADDNGFVEAADFTAGIGLTDATRGIFVTSFKTMQSTSGTTAINAYNFATSSTAIVKDAQDTTEDSASGTELTISSFTVASNSNRILIVCPDVGQGTQEVSGITWNTDEDFTRAVAANAGGGANRRAEIWYLINPTATTADIVTTWGSAAIDKGMGVYSYYNVDQTTPLGITNTDTASGTTTTGTLTPTTAGSLIVDSYTVNVATVTDTLTAGWTNGVGADKSYNSQYNLTPTISVSNDMFYVNDEAADWVWVGAEIKAAVTGSDTQGEVDFYLQVVD